MYNLLIFDKGTKAIQYRILISKVLGQLEIKYSHAKRKKKNPTTLDLYLYMQKITFNGS